MEKRVTYLYHSGFVVELAEHVLVFDDTGRQETGLPEGKRLLWFASHKHGDHFQLSSLRRAWENKASHYFVGNDIKLNGGYLERNGISPAVLANMTRMRGAQVYEDAKESLRVEALHSTDQGVAFLVTVEGCCIYHGGDLNNWYWPGELPDKNRKMERDYQREIDTLAGRRIDLAFVPLDPRLEEGYALGMDYFLKKTDARAVFPMHMWENYQVIKRYRETETGRKYRDRIQDITGEKQVFVI